MEFAAVCPQMRPVSLKQVRSKSQIHDGDRLSKSVSPPPISESSKQWDKRKRDTDRDGGGEETNQGRRKKKGLKGRKAEGRICRGGRKHATLDLSASNFRTRSLALDTSGFRSPP